MPDISMCLNHKCPSKTECHRYMAIPNSYQAYAQFDYDVKKGKCEYYIHHIRYNDYRSNNIKYK